MNIMVYTFPFRGHSIQAIYIANYLSNRGHSVTVDTNPCFFRYVSTKIKKKESLYKFLKYEDTRKKDTLLQCAEGILITAKKYENEYKNFSDLIIFDSMAYWGKIIAEKYNIPSISLFTIQPFNKMHFKHFAYDYLKDYSCVFDSIEQFYRFIHIYEINAKNKFELMDDFTFDDIFCARGDNNIVLLPKSICRFYNELDDSFKVFSPIIDFKKKYNKKNGIYISTGSMISDVIFLESCINTFITKKIELHVSSGRFTNQLKKKYNKYHKIHFYEFAPQRELLEQSLVFITHGGSNSICEAIASNTPMIVFPFTNDEFINAEMVEMTGIGEIIEKKMSNFEKKLSTIYEKIISDYDYIENITDISYEIDSCRVWNEIDKVVERI